MFALPLNVAVAGQVAVGAGLAGVLGGERGDHAHAVGAVGGEGLEVGLDPGTPAGIRAGEG